MWLRKFSKFQQNFYGFRLGGGVVAVGGALGRFETLLSVSRLFRKLQGTSRHFRKVLDSSRHFFFLDI
jgi:hypothetical protein